MPDTDSRGVVPVRGPARRPARVGARAVRGREEHAGLSAWTHPARASSYVFYIGGFEDVPRLRNDFKFGTKITLARCVLDLVSIDRRIPSIPMNFWFLISEIPGVGSYVYSICFQYTPALHGVHSTSTVPDLVPGTH